MKESSMLFVPTHTKCDNRRAVNACVQLVGCFQKCSAQCPTEMPYWSSERVCSTTIVDDWLAAFILEAQCADGDLYPASTLKNILVSYLRVMKGNLGATHFVSFVEKSSQERYNLHFHNALGSQL